jgi:hypothetical protein
LTYKKIVAIAALSAGAALAGVHSNAATPIRRPAKVFAPDSNPRDLTYGEWAGRWWAWGMSLPVPGNPLTDTATFDVTEGQSGDVWFLAAPFGTNERTGTIPKGKNLLVGLLNTEFSSLEGFATEQEQRDTASFFADFIVVDSLFCTIDGDAVSDLADFRFQSPQFSFTAPTPWIFGDTGGAGTSVADGFYVMLKSLDRGDHTLHYGGTILFPDGSTASIDMTYHLTQQ